jgi:hypothetical protein
MQIFELPAGLRNVMLTRTSGWSEPKTPRASKKRAVGFQEPAYPKGSIVAEIDRRTKMIIRPGTEMTALKKFENMNTKRLESGKPPMKKLRVIR